MHSLKIEKRGQITIFILVIILILLAIGFVFYSNNKGFLDEIKQNIVQEVELSYIESDVRNYIENCLRQTAIEAIFLLGLHGGTINKNSKSIVIETSFVNYGYFIGKNTLPLIQKMEDELSNYINEGLDFCLNDFSDFKNKAEINYDNTITKTSIRNNIIFNVNKKIEITKDDFRISFSEFKLELPIRLKHLHELSTKIINEEINDRAWLPYDVISEFDVSVAVYIYNKDTIIFSLVDNKSIIDDQKFIFQFANKFDLNYEDPVLKEANELIPKLLRQ